MTDYTQELSKLKVTELKDHLRARSLPLGGKKVDLVVRLHEALYGAVPVGAEGPAPSAVSPSKRVGRSAKDPLEYVKEKVVSSNSSLEQVLRTVMSVYNLEQYSDALVEVVADVAETMPPIPEAPETFEDLSKLRVTELKLILKSRGQKTSGKKNDLIHRILDPEAVDESSPSKQLPPSSKQLPTPGVTPPPFTGAAVLPVPGVPAVLPPPVYSPLPTPGVPAVLPPPVTSPLPVPGVPAVLPPTSPRRATSPLPPTSPQRATSPLPPPTVGGPLPPVSPGMGVAACPPVVQSERDVGSPNL